jgi:hypothetical protein
MAIFIAVLAGQQSLKTAPIFKARFNVLTQLGDEIFKKIKKLVSIFEDDRSKGLLMQRILKETTMR